MILEVEELEDLEEEAMEIDSTMNLSPDNKEEDIKEKIVEFILKSTMRITNQEEFKEVVLGDTEEYTESSEKKENSMIEVEVKFTEEEVG